MNALSGAVIGAAQKVSPDLLIEDCLIAEIKAAASIEKIHRQQCLNSLRASNLKLGRILNFGHAHLEVGRVVFHF